MTTRKLVILALFAIAAIAAPAAAHDGRGARFSAPRPPSVFPVPRDPWRSWGVRSELPKRVGPPRADVWHGGDGTPGPGSVWIPGHWAWNGAAWVWWPGYWAAR
jgi:hypothetical protein